MPMTMEEIPTFALAVVIDLGEGWRHVYDADFNRDGFSLHGPDRAEIFVSQDRYGNGGKLHISARYPKNSLHDVKDVSINVSTSRGPANVAREIKRRVLPTYLPELARVLAHLARRHELEADRYGFACELNNIVGGWVERDDRLNRTHVSVSRSAPDDALRLNIELSGDGMSRGTFTATHLSADQLRALCAVVRKTDAA